MSEASPAPVHDNPPAQRRSLGARFFVIAAMLGALGILAWIADMYWSDYRFRMQVVGQELAYFELPTLHDPNRAVTARNLRGKPNLLVSWGTWCPGCRLDHPKLMAFSKRHRVRLIGVNMLNKPTTAIEYLMDNGDPYALNLIDRDGEITLMLKMYATPAYILTDADGVIRWRHIGTLTDPTIESGLVQAIRAVETAP
jgi:cytochrome c biogenesis protein CcmG, thiol:disulfide interchange protein DsbE